MFESMNQDGRQNAMMYFMSLLVSLLVHAAILCVFAVLPLVFFSALHADELVTILIDPPSPSILHPTPVLQAKVSAAAKNIVTYGSIDPVPDHIPVGIPPAEDTPMAIGIDRVI
jgi:hypothetical protein